jgi:nucleoside-diphosphate-sugar epimerase
MKSILVTGGMGYIGNKFIELFSEKYDILVFDTSFFGQNKSDSIKIISGDIRKIDLDDLSNIEVIVHMSELSNDPLGAFNPQLTKEINHNGTKNILKLANHIDVKKFIYMSSASVYGFNQNLLDEKSEVNPLTEYALAKINNENYILENNFEFETIIFRNSTVFGFSKNLRLDLVVNDLTYNALKNNKIDVISDGSPKRPFIHVHDLCMLIDIVISDNRNIDKEIFNVGDNSLNYSIKEISKIISDLTNVKDITFGDKDDDQRSYYLSFDKLNKIYPDFKIEFDMSSGILDLINNLKNYKLSGNEIRLRKLDSLKKGKKVDSNLFWI